MGLEYCDTIEMTKVKFNARYGSKFPELEEKSWEKTKLDYFESTANSPEFSYWNYRRIM